MLYVISKSTLTHNTTGKIVYISCPWIKCGAECRARLTGPTIATGLIRLVALIRLYRMLFHRVRLAVKPGLLH